MSDYQFQSTLYRTRDWMLDAVVDADLSTLSGSDLDEYLGRMSDEELAAECIDGFGLNVAEDDYYDEEEAQSHMDKYGYDAADLAAAFRRFRDKRSAEAEAA